MTFQAVQKTGDNIRLYHTDHLGSTALVTDLDGEVTQHVAYIPYGEIFVEQRNGSWASPYLFNAKELDEETGLYYYGARYLDPTGTRWLSVDPLFEKYVGMTPYGYCEGNPVKFLDPTGESTKVAQNEDGTYTVIDVEINDDNGIYCNDKLIGYSATPYSFYDTDRKKIMKGAIIDPNDNSGKDFLNNTLQRKNSNIVLYMNRARGRKLLDFKRTNGTPNVLFEEDVKDQALSEEMRLKHYRGMPINLEGPNKDLPVYASARDIGNIGAGFIAGSNKTSWVAARTVMDAYQSYTSSKLVRETAGTQYAEYLGYRIGAQAHDYAYGQALRGLPSYGGPLPPKPSRSILKLSDYSFK